MTLALRCLVAFALLAGTPAIVFAQGGATPSSGGSPSGPSSPSVSSPSPPTGPASSGTFSIEAEIFGYKSLQSDSEAIACDIVGFLYADDQISARPYGKNVLSTPPDWTDEGDRRYEPWSAVCKFKGKTPDKASKGVIILSSTSNAIANYQLWRLDMTVMQVYLQQASNFGCPTAAPTGVLDFVFDPSTAGQAIAVVQSALQLFANSESALEVTGTIQDQALMDDVARGLRNLKVPVILPDLYTSFSFGDPDYTKSPFLSRLVKLIVERNCLQLSVQDAAAKVRKITDVTAERDSYLKIRSTILEKEIDPKITALQKKTLDDEVSDIQKKIDDLNQQLDSLNADGPQITINAVQSLTSSIDGFVATLLGATPASPGSSPSSTPSSAPSTPSPPSSPSAPPPTTASPAPTASGSPTPTPAPSGAIPPIVSAMAGDGLSRRLYLKIDEKVTLHDSDWRVLTVKALESGGALITTTNIFGSKVHFSGGAVATYALFSFDGNLQCSGNVFDYGGYMRPSQFVKRFRRPNIEPDKQLIFLRGGCTTPPEEKISN